jgi:hypothetical protein
MFTLDSTIDTIQNSKKQFVNAFVLNENVAKSFNSFLDAQGEATKKVIKANQDIVAVLMQEALKVPAAKSNGKSA